MRLLKNLGLAVIAAMALVALTGSATATAANTVLCKEATEVCPAGRVYAAGTKFKNALGSGKTMRLEFPALLREYKCSKAEMSGEYTNTSGEPATATISAVSLSECQNETYGFITLKPVGLPYHAALTTGSGGNGTIAITAGSESSSNPGFIVENLGSGTCLVKAERIEGTVKGGNPATIAINEARFEGPGTCPMKMTTPPAETVTETSTALCKANESYCQQSYSTGTPLTLSLKPETTTVLSDITALGSDTARCKESTMSGSVTRNPGIGEGGNARGEITSASWGSCGRYNSAGELKESCSVEARQLPWVVPVARTSSGNGTMWLRNHLEGSAPKMKVVCGLVSFTVRGSEGEEGESIQLGIAGGAPAGASANAKLVDSIGGAATWTAEYNLSPEPLWVTSHFIGERNTGGWLLVEPAEYFFLTH